MTVYADPATCSVQFDPIGKTKFDKTGLRHRQVDTRQGRAFPTVIRAAPAAQDRVIRSVRHPGSTRALASAGDLIGDPPEDAPRIAEAGYPAKADPARINTPLVIAILTALVLLVTMVYGPIAALLVELFPSRIRYTAMSLPYHIGNGWFGGFLPTIAFAMVAATGNIYAGLWYPIGVAVLTLVVGLLWLPETFSARGSSDEASSPGEERLHLPRRSALASCAGRACSAPPEDVLGGLGPFDFGEVARSSRFAEPARRSMRPRSAQPRRTAEPAVAARVP